MVANLRVAVAIGCVGKFEWYKRVVCWAEPSRPFLKHFICKLLSYEAGQKFVENDPLMVPAQMPRRFFEHSVGRLFR